MEKTISKQAIQEVINESFKKIVNIEWLKNHLIVPKKISLCINIEENQYEDFWLITDHNSQKDSSYRVVFNEKRNVFGLECTLKNGTQWYMGDYGKFHEAVSAM